MSGAKSSASIWGGNFWRRWINSFLTGRKIPAAAALLLCRVFYVSGMHPAISE